VKKFVEGVEQVSFSAGRAMQIRQQVLYVTERAVFRLTREGLELLEVAPGIDLESEVLAHMAFRPRIRQVGHMPDRAFA
jgi:propionate CoA-transferase